MALSPFYGWSEPDNSSLVKNGAADIRTLGDAIDTSLWNVGFGQAGKNKIINGDFSVNQRAFTTSTTTGVFNFDRWLVNHSDGTSTLSAESFTAGAAPVAGYEAKNYIRIVTTGQTTTGAFTRYDQRIENVRTFAGQTVTVSFWAQAGTGTPSISVELQQNFGSGGSPSSVVNGIIASPAKQAISTSWARYSYTISVPSISGKTIGTSENSYLQLGLFVSAGSNFNARTGSLGIQSNTFNIWGVQVEYGSKATPFQLAGGGDPQSELAMCQRYYYRQTGPAAYSVFGLGSAYTTAGIYSHTIFPVTMRVQPTSIEYANLSFSDGAVTVTLTSISLDPFVSGRGMGVINSVVTGATQFRFYTLNANNNSAGYLAYSAEL
jgi:hypothetical protein